MKNKMIKAASILAAGVLAFSLTACGNTTETNNETNDTTIETVDTTENTDAEDNTEAIDTEDSTEATDTENNTEDTDAVDNADDTTDDEAAICTFTLEVTDAEGTTTSYEVSSSDEFLFDALDDVEGDFSYDGYESDWGFYITTVNGIVADYDTDGAYWSLYVNGEYGQNGVSTQPIENDAVYSFVYEVYAPAN